MGWQDDLRELDARLAAGSVSADDYRRARDEVLRKAQSGGAAEQPQAGPAGQQPQPPQQPSAEQPGPTPFAPAPFRWDTPQGGAQPQPQAPSENTQIIQPVASPQPERTQVVPNSQDTSGDRTQVVRNLGQDQPQQQMWGGPNPHTPPPWAAQQPPPPPQPPWGNDMESVVAPDMSWLRPGPESFEERSSKGRGKLVGIIIAAVLVVGLGVAAVLYFTGNKDNQNNPPVAGSTPQTPTSTTRQLPEPPAAKPEAADNAATLTDPPGTTRNGGGPFSPESLQTSGILPKPVVTALTGAGLKQGLLKTTVSENVTVGLFAAEVTSEDTAAQAAEAYAEAQRDGHLVPNEDLALKGVPVYNSPNGSDPVYRAVYVVYNRVVMVEVFGTNRQTAQTVFKDLLDKQVEFAPPTKRD